MKKAAERLVTANLRFVIPYVKKYQVTVSNLSELVAIGNEGLLKAFKKGSIPLRREVHLLCGVVGAASVLKALRRADSQRPHSAEIRTRSSSA